MLKIQHASAWLWTSSLRFGSSAGAFFAYNPDAWRALFVLSLQYQDAFKDATSGAVCPPATGASAAASCLTGPVGNPKETKKKLASLEVRRDLGFAGIGLTATYDFRGESLRRGASRDLREGQRREAHRRGQGRMA